MIVHGLISGRALVQLGVLSVVFLPPSACQDDTTLGLDDDRQGWTLVWEDEFDGPAGQLPDPGRWRFDVGTDWGNQQLEFDTDRPENASLDGAGNLAIIARKESYQGQAYTSARVTTQGLFESDQGLYEARIRLPSGQGIWPALWLLGANTETVGWPASGEIDIMEYRGQEPSIIHGSLHGPGYSGAQAVTGRYYLENARFDTDFHVFSVEWAENSIGWFVDGVRFQTFHRRDLPGEWVYDHPFYIILNVAVGGGFAGPPGQNTTFPQTMLVDWVRVYERDR